MTGTPPTVLLVDASLDTLEMYTVGLARLGITALTATDAATAVEQVKTRCPDVVVTELPLDGRTSGWDLIRQLKADPAVRRIPIVILTAHAGPSLAGQARSAGCAAAIPKPCLPHDLAQLLVPVLANESNVSTPERHAGPH